MDMETLTSEAMLTHNDLSSREAGTLFDLGVPLRDQYLFGRVDERDVNMSAWQGLSMAL